jgi:transcriptional repressor NrdR
VQLRELTVVKRSGRRVPFDRDKLHALDRRSPCASARSTPNGSSAWSPASCAGSKARAKATSSLETVGELVMEALKVLDDVAYVRFASVYKNFREAKDFEELLGEMEGSIERD